MASKKCIVILFFLLMATALFLGVYGLPEPCIELNSYGTHMEIYRTLDKNDTIIPTDSCDDYFLNPIIFLTYSSML